MIKNFDDRVGWLSALLITTVVAVGCVPSASYDRWVLDVVFLENDTVFVQTFHNVTVPRSAVKDDRQRNQYQKWFCDDSSDTFQREWRGYANRLGMQSIKANRIEAHKENSEGCDVQVTGSGSGFLPTAVVLSDLLNSDSYTVHKSGDRFELAVQPGRIENKLKLELNLWLSDRYPGRLLQANTPQFERDLKTLRFGLRTVFAGGSAKATGWRRASWKPTRLRQQGVQFVLEGPLSSRGTGPAGMDNRPTVFPGKSQPEEGGHRQ